MSLIFFGIHLQLLYSYVLNKIVMTSRKLKSPLQIFIATFLLLFIVTACNNSSEDKTSTDSSTVQQDTTSTMPMTDTSKMADTTQKMDTGSKRPVAPGN